MNNNNSLTRPSESKISKDIFANSCPCKGANLEKFIQPSILSILADSELTAYQVAKRLKGYCFGENESPDVAGVYRYIKIMKQKDLLAERTYLDKAQRTRRLFTTTPKGKECLSAWIETLISYNSAIQNLITKISKEQI